MKQPAAPLPPESLLAHTGWMRRLARSLVRDDAQADDVVQDAVVAAIRTPPRDRVALPAWLATAVRNGARQLWRGESRRAERERAATRDASAPDTAEVVARAEEHGLVVQAVLALDEPYRSTLLLRFFDDLPPREVAQRLGVPVETVRARARRGLEQVRGRLDAAHGGDGETWKLALLPLAWPKAAAAAAAGGSAGAGAGSGSASGAASGAGVAAGSQVTTGAMVMAGTGAAVAVGGIALVTGVCVGWWMGATKADAVAIDYGRQITEAKAQTTEVERRAKENEDRVKSQESRARGFESQLRDLQQELADTKKSLDERTAALEQAKAQLAAASVGSAPAPKKKGPRFAFDQYGKLADVDWTSVGENLSAMTPLCDSVAKKLAAGGDLPGEDLGRIQQHNGPLVAAAVKVMKELPGTGANGSFTHPAFMVNAIASTLDAAGKPLTDGEATAIEKVARDFSDEDARRLAGYPAGTYAMQKTIEEADLRRRFFDAAFAVLTKDQRETLVPPSVRGLVGFDLFSDGLLWATVMRPLQFKERETDTLVSDAAGAMNAGLRIPKEQQDAARAVVAKWARDLPASLVTAPNEGASKYETHVETVREAAKQTLALVQTLSADLKLDGKQADAARNWPVVLLPSPQRAE